MTPDLGTLVLKRSFALGPYGSDELFGSFRIRESRIVGSIPWVGTGLRQRQGFHLARLAPGDPQQQNRGDHFESRDLSFHLVKSIYLLFSPVGFKGNLSLLDICLVVPADLSKWT